MSGDVHVRICERLGVRLPRATRPILGFQYQTDADRFLENLRERLAKFGLELHPDKTRRIEFGRFAEENRKRRGEGKPETFDFLGFSVLQSTRITSSL
jgi:RNA-directed DNA polymerase